MRAGVVLMLERPLEDDRHRLHAPMRMRLEAARRPEPVLAEEEERRRLLVALGADHLLLHLHLGIWAPRADPRAPHDRTLQAKSVRPISRVARVIPQGPNSQVQMKQQVIGAEGYEKTSPFLFLSEDWFGPPGGFETHPHRGMQTVTIVLEGSLEHKDHTGAHGVLNAGDVQWMTAGRGVLHSEMPKGKVHTLQLWLNLPAKMKMIPARYKDQRLKDVPGNNTVLVYAGKSGKAEHKHGSDYPMWLLEIR